MLLRAIIANATRVIGGFQNMQAGQPLGDAFARRPYPPEVPFKPDGRVTQQTTRPMEYGAMTIAYIGNDHVLRYNPIGAGVWLNDRDVLQAEPGGGSHDLSSLVWPIGTQGDINNGDQPKVAESFSPAAIARFLRNATASLAVVPRTPPTS